MSGNWCVRILMRYSSTCTATATATDYSIIYDHHQECIRKSVQHVVVVKTSVSGFDVIIIHKYQSRKAICLQKTLVVRRHEEEKLLYSDETACS